MNDNALNGKAAIVTGAASGIGQSIARVYHDAGANVLAVGVNESRFEELANSPRLKTLMVDVTL